MFYTREQIKRLEKYRKNFETAVNSGFARNVGSIALKEIEQVYDEAYGSHYSYNSGCSVCVLGFIKRVGEPFLKESAVYAAQDRLAETPEKEAANTNTEVVENVEVKEESPVIETVKTNTTEAPKTNKRTRKKKEDGTEQ